jgi:hypothetical protein
LTIISLSTAQNDSYTLAEDTSISGNVLTNDQNEANIPPSFLGSGNPDLQPHGSFVLNSDGSFTYTPDANYYGTDIYEYALPSADGSLSIATVTFTVTSDGLNQSIANNDSYTLAEDTSISGNVLTNDQNEANIPPSFLGSGNPDLQPHGSFVLNADGSFTYTPDANYYGTDIYEYALPNADGSLSIATVTFTVTSDGIDQTANNDSYTLAEDTSISGNVLTNDISNEANIPPSLLGSGNPDLQPHGSFVLNSDGSFTYTPDANYYGTDIYEYALPNADGSLSMGLLTN